MPSKSQCSSLSIWDAVLFFLLRFSFNYPNILNQDYFFSCHCFTAQSLVPRSLFIYFYFTYFKKSDDSPICLQVYLHIHVPALHFYLFNFLSYSYSSHLLPLSGTNDLFVSSSSTDLVSSSPISMSSRHEIFDLYFSFSEDSGHLVSVCELKMCQGFL